MRQCHPLKAERLQVGEVLERRGQGSSSLRLEAVIAASGGRNEVRRRGLCLNSFELQAAAGDEVRANWGLCERV